MTSDGAPRKLPRELVSFLELSAILTVLSLGFIVFVGLRPSTLPHHGLSPVLSLQPQSFLTDFRAPLSKMGQVHSPSFFTEGYKWIYPAPIAVLMRGFSALGAYSSLVYLFLTILLNCRLIAVAADEFKKRGLPLGSARFLLVSTAVLSWPLQLSLHQGNLETLIWCILAAGLWKIYRQQWWAAAILIAIGSSFKLYPLIFLALLLRKRKYPQILVALAIFIAINLVSLAWMGPSVIQAYRNVSAGMRTFAELGFWPFRVDRDFLALDHSLVSLIRVCILGHPQWMTVVGKVFEPFCVVIMGGLFFTRLWRMPVLNQMFFLCLGATLLTPKSYDYTLLTTYVPWALLSLYTVSAGHRGWAMPGVTEALLLLSFIFSSNFFLRFRADYAYGQYRAAAILLLLGVTIARPFEDPDNKLGAVRTGVDQGSARA